MNSNIAQESNRETTRVIEIQQLDLYGFTKNSKEAVQTTKEELKKINARIQKWRQMMPSIEPAISQNKKHKKLKQRIRKGIPQCLKFKVWPILAQLEKFKKENNLDFEKLINEANFPYQQDIAVDLPRTFPHHNMFSNKKKDKNSVQSSKNGSVVKNKNQEEEQKSHKESVEEEQEEGKQMNSSIQSKKSQNSEQKEQVSQIQKEKEENNIIKQNQQLQLQQHNHNSPQLSMGQQSLNNVLKALSISFKDMGYCQGLNFVAASMMIYLNDEEAYLILYSLMTKYKCLELYKNVAVIYKFIHIYEYLLKKFLPKIKEKQDQLDIQSMFYATPWFMTLFSSVLPFNLFARIFDIFLYEDFKIIYRTALTLLKLKEEQILKCKNMDQFMNILRDYNYYNKIDEDIFIKTAFSFKFSKKLIIELENDYIDKNILERRENYPSMKQ